MIRRVPAKPPGRKKAGGGSLSTREKLRDAAIDLFARSGFDGVSVRDITRAVGIKESSLYNHYPSKEALLEGVLDHFQKSVFPKAPPDEIIGKTLPLLGAVAFMKSGVTRFLEHWEDPDRRKAWFVVSMEQYKNAKAAAIILEETAGVVRTTETIFRKMIDFKMIKPCDPKAFAAAYAYALRAMHLEYELQKTLGLDTADSKKRMFELVDLTLSLLQPGP